MAQSLAVMSATAQQVNSHSSKLVRILGEDTICSLHEWSNLLILCGLFSLGSVWIGKYVVNKHKQCLQQREAKEAFKDKKKTF